MDNKKINNTLQGLDLTEVAYKLSQMALKVISGKEIKEKTYSVPLCVPEELAEVFELLSERAGVSIEEVLAQLARQGFDNSLKQFMQQSQKPSSPPPKSDMEQVADAVGYDMKGLFEKMNQLQGVVGKLNEMQKVFESVNETKNPKDNKQSNIPLGEVPCPSDREE